MNHATFHTTNHPRRAYPAVVRAALRSHNRNDTENGRVAALQRGTHLPTHCGYNRVIEVHDAANGSTGSPQAQIIATYRYDPFGRRLSKTLNTASTGSAQAPAGSSSYYFYSAEGLIAEADANGQIIQSYGYAPGSTFTTNPLWTKLTTAGSTTYYTYQNDHLGTPQKLLNQSGITVWSATYDAFGRATVDPASTITNNLRFPGQYYDAETTLHYNWNRYYDSVNGGRYISSDPIGLRGGVNLYAYVGGNPVNFDDYIGLCKCPSNLAASAFAKTHNTDYRRDRKKDKFKAGQYKCNKFVSDEIISNGGDLPLPNGYFGGNPITAAQWADPAYDIPGWSVVSGSPQAGDVVAVPNGWGAIGGLVAGATGHVGIVTGDKQTTSAADYEIITNDFGFRKDQSAVFRRCSCGK